MNDLYHFRVQSRNLNEQDYRHFDTPRVTSQHASKTCQLKRSIDRGEPHVAGGKTVKRFVMYVRPRQRKPEARRTFARLPIAMADIDWVFFFFSILLASLLFRTLSTQTSYMLAPLFYCVGLPRQCRSTFGAPLKSMCAGLAIDSSTPTLPPYFYSWKTVKHLRARVRARTGSAVRTKELG